MHRYDNQDHAKRHAVQSVSRYLSEVIRGQVNAHRGCITKPA